MTNSYNYNYRLHFKIFYISIIKNKNLYYDSNKIKKTR